MAVKSVFGLSSLASRLKCSSWHVNLLDPPEKKKSVLLCERACENRKKQIQNTVAENDTK